jgi:hypothetical protein
VIILCALPCSFSQQGQMATTELARIASPIRVAHHLVCVGLSWSSVISADSTKLKVQHLGSRSERSFQDGSLALGWTRCLY